MKVVDLSGYSFSGKSAVYDWLSEHPCAVSFGMEFEFDLIRAPDGLLDLKHKIADHWSPVRSSEAISRFKRLAHNLGGDGGILSRLTRAGTHYDLLFPGYTRASKEYLRSLIKSEWRSYWPFSYLSEDGLQLFIQKLCRKIPSSYLNSNAVYFSRIEQESFIELTRDYLDNVLSSALTSDSNTVIVSNAFEPNQPQKGMELVRNSFCIIVDRDPRDIYVSAWTNSKNSRLSIGKATIGESISDFVCRYKGMRMDPDICNDSVIKIQFEEFILNHEEVSKDILSKIGLEDSAPSNSFNIERSKENIGLWKSFEDQSKIKFIEENLGDFCSEY